MPQATVSVITEMKRIPTQNVEDIELHLAKANSVSRQVLAGITYTEIIQAD